MKEDITYKTDILRYDIDKKTWVLRKDHDLLQNFKFAGIEFYLVYKQVIYFICVMTPKNDLFSLVYRKEKENGLKLTPGEIVSDFRKNFLKHNVDKTLIENYFQDPLKYTLIKS